MSMLTLRPFKNRAADKASRFPASLRATFGPHSRFCLTVTTVCDNVIASVRDGMQLDEFGFPEEVICRSSIECGGDPTQVAVQATYAKFRADFDAAEAAEREMFSDIYD